MFPSIAKSMELRLAIFRTHIRCHASVYKNLDGSEMIFQKKKMIIMLIWNSAFSISTNQWKTKY